MFVGQFEHQLDDKGRLVLPAAFRERLAVGGYIAQGLDRCLAVWTPEDYQREADEMVERVKRGEVERNALRALAANTFEIKPDAQGRIAVPASLRTYAGLTKEVTVIGAFASIELWDSAKWHQVNSSGGALLAGQDS